MVHVKQGKEHVGRVTMSDKQNVIFNNIGITEK